MTRSSIPMVRALLAATFVLASASPAAAWDPFLSPNDNVEEGNRAMAQDDADGALEAYDRAVRELPDEPGVHLNRGLALLEQGELDEAREELLRAAEPPASDGIRADAYYDMGNAFFQEAEAAAGQEDHQTAQQLFREAADAYRRSLRARPGNRDAAWNLELALRRLREEEERQQEQEQEQDQQQQDQQNQDQQNQDQQQQDQQNQDQQNQDQQQQDQQQQDQQQQGQQNQDQQQQGQESSDREEPSQEPRQPEGDRGGEDARDETGAPGQELPQHVERVLDALQDSEESLQRHRARARGRRERREPTKDW